MMACSSTSPSPGSSPDADAGSSTPSNPEGPGITAKNCPGTPTNLNLVKVAPVWGGVVALEATVPGGVPEFLELHVLDPATGEWIGSYYSSYGVIRQKVDGTYLALATMNVREASKAKEFKLRVRARLQGCPPTGWAEGPGFTLTDPLAGTTWTAQVSGAFLNANLYIGHNGAGTSTGPYSADNAKHAVTFNADGSFAETYEYTITSAVNGDLYNNCAFQLSYVGSWSLRLDQGNPQLVLADRKPKPGGATTGSTCSAPPLADLAINQADPAIRIARTSTYLSIDYLPLLDTTPGKPVMGSVGGDVFNATLSHIADVAGGDTASVSGSMYPNDIRYYRQ